MPRVTITPPGKPSQPYRFNTDRQSVMMGRGSENDIVIDCTSVSVKHAVMERIPGGFQIRDLGSTNGTKLSGMSRDITPLIDGRRVLLGDVEFLFHLTEEEQVTLAEEDASTPAIIREDTSDEAEFAPKRGLVSEAEKESLRQELGAFARPMPMPLFALLALVALYLGLGIRYSKEHPGHSLTQDLLKGQAAVSTLPAQEEGRADAPSIEPAPQEESE
ncbi:putative component of type VI protein secretion system [Haloferula luteola]|uniref:Putative component of type VI protein secretion system n=1 Tax=Haloferula luteola TaxID=595692 RepID=A0A840UYC0_9BACT|nr:FHA domain-containing protein [Haloferula luteola]MBB5349816.1 putative component of type VI protein secretion system [Haloferula luteola]